MGSRLVREVSDHWGHLAGAPYKVLLRMALSALDSPGKDGRPAEVYWKGWADLAIGLGRKPPDEMDASPEAERQRKWMKDEVRRATSALVRAGAVQRAVDNPGRGTRQVWKLTL